MPYVLILVGIVLLVAGVRNTQGMLYAQLLKDFSGNDSFIWWAVSIGAIGSAGYINDDMRRLSNAFLLLILIVLVIHNRGVFAQLTAALKNPIPPAPEEPNAVIDNSQSNAVPSQSSSSSLFQQAGSAAVTAALAGG